MPQGKSAIRKVKDTSKLTGQGSAILTELQGRVREIKSLQLALTAFQQHSSAQFESLHTSMSHGQPTEKDFRKLQGEFRKEVFRPFESLVGKKTATASRFTETFKPCTNELPAEFGFEATCSAIEDVIAEFNAIQDTMSPQVAKLSAEFKEFEETLKRPAIFQLIEGLEKSLAKKSAEICKLVEQLGELPPPKEQADSTCLAAVKERLEARLIELGNQAQTLKSVALRM